MIKNKTILSFIISILVATTSGFVVIQNVNAEPEMTVYKSPTCGCCGKWITHMEENGFKIKAVDVIEMNVVKEKYGITRNLASCHTAIIDDYFIEGHVPAADVKRLLAEKTDSKGLTVPGMPIGSPGMEMGERVDPYQVLSVKSDGSTEVFNQY